MRFLPVRYTRMTKTLKLTRSRKWLILGFASALLVSVGLLAGFASFLLMPGLAADYPKTIESAPSCKAPSIDGVLGEDEWKDATAVETQWNKVRGINFFTSDAKNATDMWRYFDVKRAERELRWMKELGFNSVRLWLSEAAWHENPKLFVANLESCLDLAAKQNLTAMLVLFDCCGIEPRKDAGEMSVGEAYRRFLDDPSLPEKQKNEMRSRYAVFAEGRGRYMRIPVGKDSPPDIIFWQNWTPNPGYRRLGKDNWAEFDKYADDVAKVAAGHANVIAIDIMNEPATLMDLPTGTTHAEAKAEVVAFVAHTANYLARKHPHIIRTIGCSTLEDMKALAEYQRVLSIHSYVLGDRLVKTLNEAAAFAREKNKSVLLTECLANTNNWLNKYGEEGLSSDEGQLHHYERTLPVILKSGMGFYAWGGMVGAMFTPTTDLVYPSGYLRPAAAYLQRELVRGAGPTSLPNHAADKPIPIIFDTDIGTDVDDAYALVLAARHQKLDLRAVTTVNGKVQVRAAIARKLLDLMGKDKIPVAAGSSKPLDGHETFWGGWEGKGLLAPEEKVAGISPQRASDLILDLLEKSPEKITIVAVGGLSNVAEVLQKAPKLKSKIERLVIMGGSVRPILIEEKMLPEKIETNLHNDAVAAEQVLRAGIPITLVPAEVTFKSKLLLKDYATIQKSSAPLPRAMTAMTDLFQPLMQKFMKANGIVRYYDDCAAMLHDPLAVVTLAEPGIAKVERMTIRLETDKGKVRTILDPKGAIAVDVVTDADIPRLSETVTKHVLK
jgi:inosine-uridine nucleoside N-ribohydrolase